jgi:hypothetical protein
MSEQPHGPTQHHQPEKTGNPDTKGIMSGNKKWYVVGALAGIAILVFVFVRKSNANASTSSTTTPPTTGLDATTTAMLQSALQGLQSGAYGSGYYGPASGSTAPPAAGGTTTPPTSTGSFPLTMPNGQLGWETVDFPSQAAIGEWTSWNQAQTQPGTRSAWNAELASLGATGYIPEATYNPNAPLGSPGNTGNRLDTS